MDAKVIRRLLGLAVGLTWGVSPAYTYAGAPRLAVVTAAEQCSARNLSLLAPLSQSEKERVIPSVLSQLYSASRQWLDMNAMLSNLAKYPGIDPIQTQRFAVEAKAKYDACYEAFELAVKQGADPSLNLASQTSAAMGFEGYKILIEHGANPNSRDQYLKAPYGFLAIRTLARFNFFDPQPGVARPSTPQDLVRILDILLSHLDTKSRDRYGRPIGFYVVDGDLGVNAEPNKKTVDAMLYYLKDRGVDLSLTWKAALGGGTENLTAYYRGGDPELIALMLGKKEKFDARVSSRFKDLAGPWNGILKVRSLLGETAIALTGEISPSGMAIFTAENGVLSSGQVEEMGQGRVILHLKNKAPGATSFADGSTESLVDMDGVLLDGVIRGTFKGASDTGYFVLCNNKFGPSCI